LAEAAAAIRAEQERRCAEHNAVEAARVAAQHQWVRDRQNVYHRSYEAEARKPEMRHMARWVDPGAAHDQCRAVAIAAVVPWERKHDPVKLGFPPSTRTSADVDSSRWAALVDGNVGWQGRLPVA
jgi:hypothetical protein